MVYLPFQPPSQKALGITGHHLILSSMTKNVEEIMVSLCLLYECKWLTCYFMLDSPSEHWCHRKKTQRRNFDSKVQRPKTNPDWHPRARWLPQCCRLLRKVVSHRGYIKELCILLQPQLQSSGGRMELISARRGIRQVYSYSRFRMENFLCEHRLFSNIQYALDISIFNVIFQVCKSYPRAVVVPASISDETLKYSAVFRNSGRFPVLSYRHTNGVSTKILF